MRESIVYLHHTEVDRTIAMCLQLHHQMVIAYKYMSIQHNLTSEFSFLIDTFQPIQIKVVKIIHHLFIIIVALWELC